MKYLLITVFFSLGISAAEYSANDGTNPPGTFTSKKKVQAEAGAINSSGISPDEMNTSPNPAPRSEREAMENATLSNGRYVPDDGLMKKTPKEIQAQEESALDYSTTPEKRPKSKKNK